MEVSLWIKRDGVELSGGELGVDVFRIDVFSPFDLQRLGVFAAALGDVEPFVGERAAHAAKDAAIDQVADGGLHHAPGRGGGKEDRLFGHEQLLQFRVNVAVEVFERFAAMADHGAREGGHGFLGDFDGAGSEELVVWNALKQKRPTFNAQRPTLEFRTAGLSIQSVRS